MNAKKGAPKLPSSPTSANHGNSPDGQRTLTADVPARDTYFTASGGSPPTSGGVFVQLSKDDGRSVIDRHVITQSPARDLDHSVITNDGALITKCVRIGNRTANGHRRVPFPQSNDLRSPHAKHLSERTSVIRPVDEEAA